VVNINGRPTMLVIGREYVITLKPGAVLTKKAPSKKNAAKTVVAKVAKPVKAVAAVRKAD
jgi:hypothetical protein